jgi:hypothetical protein
VSALPPLPAGTILDVNGDAYFNAAQNIDSAGGDKARALAYVRCGPNNYIVYEVTGPGYNQQQDILQYGFPQGGVGTLANQGALAANGVNGLRFTTEIIGAPLIFGPGELNSHRMDTEGIALNCRVLGLQQTKPNYRGGQDVTVIGPCAKEPDQIPSIDGTVMLYNFGGSLCYLDANGNKTVLVPAQIVQGSL